jgi:hypothetical protein
MMTKALTRPGRNRSTSDNGKILSKVRVRVRARVKDTKKEND